ncbi:unnamed protein product, partial [Nesidiocoris tenuis]
MWRGIFEMAVVGRIDLVSRAAIGQPEGPPLFIISSHHRRTQAWDIYNYMM